jgi:4-amino-4-deoxy-L-arabinose transferase-like glycosyltransferase
MVGTNRGRFGLIGDSRGGRGVEGVAGGRGIGFRDRFLGRNVGLERSLAVGLGRDPTRIAASRNSAKKPGSFELGIPCGAVGGRRVFLIPKDSAKVPRLAAAIGLATLLAVALSFFTWHNTFPETLHADEGKKVNFILGGAPDFHHPIMLIQAGRGIQALTGWDGREGAVRAARWGSAIAAIGCLLLFYVWSRPMFGRGLAFAGVGVLASTPLLAVHAHYAKEDVMLAAGVMGVVWALQHWRNRAGLKSDLLLGLALGLAASTHYKSVLVLVLVGMVMRERSERANYRVIVAAALGVFLTINFPLIARPLTFLGGAGTMFTNAVGGQEVDVYPVPSFYLYHFFHSLIPGLGWGVLLWSIVGAGVLWKSEKTVGFDHRLAVVGALMFYFVVEFSPKKPPPDFSRYVLPCAPFVVWLALHGWKEAWQIVRVKWGRYLLVVSTLILLALPAIRAWEIVNGLENDTRVRAVDWVRTKQKQAQMEGGEMNVLAEKYATVSPEGVVSVAEQDLGTARAAGLTHVLVSSFRYDRYLKGAKMTRQRAAIYDLGAFYEDLFRQPFEEITPLNPSYAFSNPTLRLVDIRKMQLPEKPLLRRPLP